MITLRKIKRNCRSAFNLLERKVDKMKKLFCFMSLIFMTGNASGGVEIAKDFKMNLTINTRGRISIVVSIPKLGSQFDESIKPLPEIEMREILFDRTIISASSIRLSVGREEMDLEIFVGPDLKSFLQTFKKNEGNYFHLSDSLLVKLSGSDTLIFTPQKMKEVSSALKIELSQEQIDELIKAKGGYAEVFNNKIDAGLRDAPNDPIDRAGYLDFTFSRTLAKNAYSQISGLLSSNRDDKIANVKVSPFVFRSIAKHSLVFNSYFQSNLRGEEVRIAGSLFYNGIVSNFLDLTQGHNRLRPKPIISLGMNFSYYTASLERQLEEKIIGEPFIELMYYIPILDRYTMNLEMYAFWRTDKDFKFKKENADWKWTLALHYDYNGTSKIMGKYSYGRDSFTKETDNRFMMGFLLDLVEQ